jgi:hypothetical protein
MSSVPTKQQALHDLGYEWRMFRTMHSLLTEMSDIDDPVRDAMVESLVLHARNLIETFYQTREGKETQRVLSIRPERMGEEIGRLYGAASSRIVHLSPDRPAVKPPWEFAPLIQALESKILGLRHAGTIPTDGWEGDRPVATKLLSLPRGPSASATPSPMDPISPTGGAQPGVAVPPTSGVTGPAGPQH